MTIRRFEPVGRLHGLLSAGATTSLAQRLLRPMVRPDTMKMWASSPSGFAAAWHAIRARPDIVSVINWYGGWLPFQMCLARRVRRFALVGVPLFHTEIPWARAPVQAEMLQRYDAVIALTEHERAFMAAVADKAHVIGAGVDSSAVERLYGHACAGAAPRPLPAPTRLS